MKKLQLATLALPLLYLPVSFAEIQLNGFASVRATQVDSDNGGKDKQKKNENQKYLNVYKVKMLVNLMKM